MRRSELLEAERVAVEAERAAVEAERMARIAPTPTGVSLFCHPRMIASRRAQLAFPWLFATRLWSRGRASARIPIASQTPQTCTRVAPVGKLCRCESRLCGWQEKKERREREDALRKEREVERNDDEEREWQELTALLEQRAVDDLLRTGDGVDSGHTRI